MVVLHNFTTKQVQKFFDAVGGVYKGASTVFTTGRLRRLAELGGGLRDWPKHTDDPRVNYAVDCVVDDTGEEESAGYDEQLYTAEIEAWRAHEAKTG